MKKVKGRAYTAAEKKEIINRLYSAWVSSNDIRLGQLISDATYGTDLFYIEDYHLVEDVERLINEVK